MTTKIKTHIETIPWSMLDDMRLNTIVLKKEHGLIYKCEPHELQEEKQQVLDHLDRMFNLNPHINEKIAKLN